MLSCPSDSPSVSRITPSLIRPKAHQNSAKRLVMPRLFRKRDLKLIARY